MYYKEKNIEYGIAGRSSQSYLSSFQNMPVYDACAGCPVVRDLKRRKVDIFFMESISVHTFFLDYYSDLFFNDVNN